MTGSSDGIIRVVQLLPTKLLGIVTNHGDYPVERVVIDRAGEGRWVGSVGHDDVLKLTDLKDIFEDEDKDNTEGGVCEDVDGEEDPSVAVTEMAEQESKAEDSDSEVPELEEEHKSKKRKKRTKDSLSKKREKKGRNQIVTDPSFFSGL